MNRSGNRRIVHDGVPIKPGQTGRPPSIAGCQFGEAEAAKFLDDELAHPASAADIATSVGDNKELAAQVYIAVVYGAHSVSATEPAFLADLAKALGVAPALSAHLSAAFESAS